MSTQKLGTVPEVMAKNAHADILSLWPKVWVPRVTSLDIQSLDEFHVPNSFHHFWENFNFCLKLLQFIHDI